MNMKKVFSILLAFVLLAGVVAPCFPVNADTEHQHTYGEWSFDAVNGTQSRTCSGCSAVQTLHGTTNKAEQVTDPEIGGTYYLAANVAGTLQYFLLEGKVTDTDPYSLHLTDDVTNAKIREITLEAALEDGKGEFQMTFLNSGTKTYIYCYDAKNSDSVMDTGTNAKNTTAEKNSFYVDELNGVTVIRDYGNDNVLVAKYNKTVSAWRMLAVPASELGTEGVYPAMLVVNHTHAYGTEYENDASKHWLACDCGAKTQETDHTYGDWTFDAENGTQSKLCTVCGHVGETLHGTTNKATQVTDPAVGGSYYLVANMGGTLRYFVSGTVTLTNPYSLKTIDYPENASQVTLMAETVADIKGEFRMSFDNSGTTAYIYCRDETNDGVPDTGTRAQNVTAARCSFYMDEVNGVTVIREYGDDYVLAVKEVTHTDGTTKSYRMLGVAESELANEGVYPVMFATLHTHSYGADYGYDAAQHWQVCDCGSASDKENHTFTDNECVCGASNAPHECQSSDGKWYQDGDKHYQTCGTCVEKINQADHTYGDWTFDAENGTQSKLCTACGHVGETLHGTTNKATQVTDPAVGGSYYLVANMGGTLRYFVTGTVTATNPYSLKTIDYPENATQVTLVAETVADIKGEFRMSFDNSGTTAYIYCRDETNDGVPDTGTRAQSLTAARCSFYMDEVNGVTVIREYGDDYVLAVKEVTHTDGTTKSYRMLGVAESELANEGVYPVMFATLHTHSYGADYEYDDEQHWQLCDCGSASDKENHTFTDNECVCGASNAPHECQSSDGKWYQDGDKHYQTCGTCVEKINQADHTYGDWTFDTENGTQSKLCTVCGHVGETLHGTTDKAAQVTDPAVGGNYYLVANIGGTLRYFVSGTVTLTNPYSLKTIDYPENASQVTLVAETVENIKGEFRMSFDNSGTTAYIYCRDETNDGVPDTGTRAQNVTAARCSFYMDEVNGVTVIREYGDDYVLAVKEVTHTDGTTKSYRMLGVAESELANEGVYPVMFATLHEHTHTDDTYYSDDVAHWRACACGGKSNYAYHTAENWTYTTVPTQTTAGHKTGTCTVCGNEASVDIPPMVEDGHYYLTGSLGGKTYYFRPQSGDESVEDTVPFSLMATTKKSEAMKVDVVWDEVSNTYVLNYTQTRTLNIYMADVNGSTVAQDGKVDLAASGTTVEDRITFYWDSVNKWFYQMEGGERYVMAFKEMTFTDGKTKAVRMLAVPESELSDTTVPVQLKTVHIHDYSSKWSGDALNHYHVCSCGAQKDVGAHDVPTWTVVKEATDSAAGKKTGNCTVCGQTVVNAIPMLTDNIQAPANSGTYYLTGTLDGKQYYFSHTPLGGSVADTYPYSLYTDPGTGIVTPLKVKVTDGVYNLSYLRVDLYLYISGDGVGTTSKFERKDLVDFQWDDENKVVYQMENNVKCVLVFKKLTTNDGEEMVRITSMPLEQALIDPTVAIARFTTKAPAATETSGVPNEATPLKETAADTGDDAADAQSDFVRDSADKNGLNMRNLFIAVAIVAIVVPGLILLLMALKNSAFGLVFFRKWNVWAGLCVMAAGVVLLGAMLLPNLLGPGAPGLEKFTIVANETTAEEAEALAVEIYEDHGISLPVVDSKDFDGEYGIYLNVTGFNSYGGYKYKISNESDTNSAGVYIDGTGEALETAISKWTKSLRKSQSFPFGMEEEVIGYEWNTGDVNMTGLGFELKEMNSRELYEGVEMRELKYESFAYGNNTGYAVIVDADAPVELKVSAGEWDENTDADNPAKKYTVQKHGKRLTEAGYEVIAITNAGFYDLNSTMTYIPWGMQIVEGLVKKEPNTDNPKNTDNWFAQTGSGEYVISNTDGYYETYETTLSAGVGGGLILMENGKPCFSSTTTDYRTVVGITKDGDLVILAISGANYAVVTQAFMDMDLDIDCILNLDGGGSTTMHALSEEGKLQQYICETPVEREVADAIAIVKKK